MTRSLGAGLAADITAATGERARLIELQFADQAGVPTPVWITTASQDLVWAGTTWQSVGGRMNVEALGESADDPSNSHRLSLSGVDQSVLALILGSTWKGRIARSRARRAAAISTQVRGARTNRTRPRHPRGRDIHPRLGRTRPRGHSPVARHWTRGEGSGTGTTAHDRPGAGPAADRPLTRRAGAVKGRRHHGGGIPHLGSSEGGLPMTALPARLVGPRI